jgi:hypothetical protein
MGQKANGFKTVRRGNYWGGNSGPLVAVLGGFGLHLGLQGGQA